MDLNSVHRVLQQVFPQVDSPLLRDVAVEHSNHAGAAAKDVLAEVIPHLLKQSITSPSDALSDGDPGYIQNEAAIQMDPSICSKAMSEKDTLSVEMVNTEDEFKLNSMITTSGQICSTQLLDVAIEDARNNKKTLVLTMESVMNLMREVECKEKAAEQAKVEAAWSSLDILAKVDELKQAQQLAEEANDMFAGKVNSQKVGLASEMEDFQHRVVSLLGEGDRYLGVLDEIRRALDIRLTAASIKKEAADKEKLEIEISAQQALAYQVSQMKKVVEESKRLKREADENYKLQEFLVDCGHVIDKLLREISVNCRYVNPVKEELNQAIMLSGLLSSSPTSSILASSTSSLMTIVTRCDPHLQIIDSYETSKESAKLADSSVFLETSNLSLEKWEGTKSRETKKPFRLQTRCIQEECECRKWKIFRKVMKRTAVRKVKAVITKRNQLGTKNLKNKEMKRWIFKKGIKRRIAVSKVKAVRNKRNQLGTKNIKNTETKRWVFKKRIKRRIAVSKVKAVRNKRNQLGTKNIKNMETKRWIFKNRIQRRIAVCKVKVVRNKRNQLGTKNTKNKETKRQIFKKGITRRIAVSNVKAVRNKRNQLGTKNIKNKETKRWVFKKSFKRRIVVSKVKVVRNKRNQ